jgi:hypothetical protein
LQVRLAWGQPEPDAGRDRRAWAKDLQRQVQTLWLGLGASQPHAPAPAAFKPEA